MREVTTEYAGWSPSWPDGRDFAFTLFDDTDFGTVANLLPVYEFLMECGMRTTKSVWPIAGTDTPHCGGDTCDNPGYLEWVRSLEANGFEIALHNVTYHTSLREQTQRGFERFRELFGRNPDCFANHTGCRESIYWGDARLGGWRRTLYNIITRNRRRGEYRGHLDGDPHFWGDICHRSVRYVRNFTFPDLNTLRRCPWMPYHDPQRPFVPQWFASTEGADPEIFVRSIDEKSQDRLVKERGACIMYTHFAVRFFENGRIHPEFERLMLRLSSLNGWFVPVATLLDYIRAQRGDCVITDRQRSCLERRWLMHKIRFGYS